MRLRVLSDHASGVRTETSPDGTTHKRTSGRTRCGFMPHHAFVFSDEKGEPVGLLQVCFTCCEWSSSPGMAGVGLRIMWPEEAQLMRQLCRELDLGGCSIGDSKEEEEISD
jgi:hypothetical protein